MALAQPQLIQSVAARAELSEAEAGRALSALEQILLEEVLGTVTRKLAGLIQTALGIDLSHLGSTGGPDQGRALAARSEGADAELNAINP